MLNLSLTPQEFELMWNAMNACSIPGHLIEIAFEARKKMREAASQFEADQKKAAEPAEEKENATEPGI